MCLRSIFRLRPAEINYRSIFMLAILDPLRTLSFTAVFIKLFMAAAFGGIIGLERERKHRPAGFRTYMIVCLGAALTMIISQYVIYMNGSSWAEFIKDTGVKTDVSRLSAQVINGIGFLGAGTIIRTAHQEVKGLTTAAGLWASACMGIAIGAGFFECVAAAFLFIIIAVCFFDKIETMLVEKSKNMNIYVEFRHLEDVGHIIAAMKEMDIHIYDVEINRKPLYNNQGPSAVFSLDIGKGMVHTAVLARLSALDCVLTIDEI